MGRLRSCNFQWAMISKKIRDTYLGGAVADRNVVLLAAVERLD